MSEVKLQCFRQKDHELSSVESIKLSNGRTVLMKDCRIDILFDMERTSTVTIVELRGKGIGK